MIAHLGVYRFGNSHPHERLLTSALHSPDPNEPCIRFASGPLTFLSQPPGSKNISDVFSQDAYGRALVWDGRLDNRSTLMSVLGGVLGSGRHIGDANVVLAAYEKFGGEALNRLIGDFSVAIWDGIDRSLLLARDFAGTRPLYYRVTDAGIEWSSDLGCFCRLGANGATLTLNDAWLYDYLRNRADGDETPYMGVLSVPPGTCLRIRYRQLSRHRLWQLDPEDVVRYGRESDYHEHFREVFRAAVGDRLRSHGSVWAELSGGLDSSSIACMAADVRRRSNDCRSLTTVTYLGPEGCTGDERPYVQSVENQLGRRGLHLHERDYSLLFPEVLESRFFARPVVAVGRPAKVSDLMTDSGANVILSGTAGDHIMWSSTELLPQLADALAQGRLLKLHQALKETGSTLPSERGRTYWNLLWRDAVRPFIPVSCRTPPKHATWIHSQARYDKRWGMTRDSLAPGALLPSRRLALQALNHAIMTCSQGPQRVCGAIDRTYPFMDRRLVQFMLAIPFEQKVRGGRSRWLHRAALDGLLPPDVCSRVSKGDGTGIICRAVNRDWSRLQAMFGERAIVAERGYVSLSGLQDALARARRGIQVKDGFHVMRAVAIETWLRHYEDWRRRLLVTGDNVNAASMNTVAAADCWRGREHRGT